MPVSVGEQILTGFGVAILVWLLTTFITWALRRYYLARGIVGNLASRLRECRENRGSLEKVLEKHVAIGSRVKHSGHIPPAYDLFEGLQHEVMTLLPDYLERVSQAFSRTRELEDLQASFLNSMDRMKQEGDAVEQRHVDFLRAMLKRMDAYVEVLGKPTQLRKLPTSYDPLYQHADENSEDLRM